MQPSSYIGHGMPAGTLYTTALLNGLVFIHRTHLQWVRCMDTISQLRRALCIQTEKRLSSLPDLSVPSKRQSKNKAKSAHFLVRKEHKESMLNVKGRATFAAPVDERTKNLFAAWRKRIESGKLG